MRTVKYPLASSQNMQSVAFLRIARYKQKWEGHIILEENLAYPHRT